MSCVPLSKRRILDVGMMAVRCMHIMLCAGVRKDDGEELSMGNAVSL
jgi:hypothetical protein